MRHMRVHKAVAVLTTAGVLAACGGASTPATNQSAAPKTGSTDINPRPRSALKAGGRFTLR